MFIHTTFSGRKCDFCTYYLVTNKSQVNNLFDLNILFFSGQRLNDGHLGGDSSAAINSSTHHSDGTQSAYTQQQTREPPPQKIDDDDAIEEDVKHEPKYSVKPSSSTYQGGGLSSGNET